MLDRQIKAKLREVDTELKPLLSLVDNEHAAQRATQQLLQVGYECRSIPAADAFLPDVSLYLNRYGC